MTIEICLIVLLILVGQLLVICPLVWRVSKDLY